MPERRDEITAALRQRVIAGLHLAVIAAGDRLPGVRKLASEFGADPRVVLAALRQLELEGLVEVRERSGVFVAHHSVAEGEMLPKIAAWALDVLMQARNRGVPPVEFPDRVHRCLRTVRLKAACIECNDDQLEGLCGELTKDYGLEALPVDVGSLSARSLPDPIHQADVLVTTAFHAEEVEKVASRARKRCIVVSLRPEFMAETTRLLRAGPVYFVGKDARFRAKLIAILASSERVENLRVLIAGQDDLTQIPDNAPTYVMRAARDQLDGLPLLARVVPAPRVFSDGSAREILSFVIGSNVAAIQEEERQATAPGPKRG